jgi:uncharacterized protein
MSADPGAELQLADWRRRIADLYADVRAMAVDDPASAWRHWAETRESLYRTHPQSPVPPAGRPSFRARHWPYDPRLRFDLTVESEPPPIAGVSGSPPLTLPNSGDEVLAFHRIGSLSIPFPEGERGLSLFWMAGYSGGLFLAFRDATNGTKTYGAGRYVLDAAKSADLGGDATRRSLVIDFNFAYQPSCAFDPRWACPLAPPENRLDLAVRAGERIA